MSKPRLLFVLKARNAYGYGGYSNGFSSGLFNSVRFLVDMLVSAGVDASMVEVIDANGIDKVVHDNRPTHAILEAIWCPAEKLDILKKLHPTVHWIVRNHSETPFLSNETNGFKWVTGYLDRAVEVMCNSPRAQSDVRMLATSLGASEHLATYGPNFYPAPTDPINPHLGDTWEANVACFGAIRPLKNQMLQAVAAIGFANQIDRPLRFHINTTRVEGSGGPILNNLRNTFAVTPEAELVEHSWLDHADFVTLLRGIDISLQASFSETFNIVSADAVTADVPIVVSSEIPWAGSSSIAATEYSRAMEAKMLQIWSERGHIEPRLKRQRSDLEKYCQHSKVIWLKRFGKSA